MLTKTPRFVRRTMITLLALSAVATTSAVLAQSHPDRRDPREPVVPSFPTGPTVPGGGSKQAAANPGEALITIEGEKQGVFKGEGLREASKTKIVGLVVENAVKAPVDKTGRPDGNVGFQALQFTKAVGAASPQLFQAAMSAEKLNSVKLEYVKSGMPEVFYVVTLENARIASVRQFNENGWFYEQVSIAYESMTVTHVESKTTTKWPVK